MNTNLVLFWATAYACIGLAQTPGTFTATGNMTTPREWHTATLLANGKVLIVGGSQSRYPQEDTILDSAELYDPSTGTFAATSSMTAPRSGHTATLLADGRVLIAGGYGPGRIIAKRAELYDPSTGTFTATGNLTTGKVAQAAALMSNGKVLVAEGGGSCGTPDVSLCPTAESAELYDPDSGTFAATGAYTGAAPTGVDSATLLSDGRVLLNGSKGFGAWAEIYDPVAGTFTLTGTPSLGAWGDYVDTATLLTKGQVLFAGSTEFDMPADAEVYESATGTFTRIGHAIASHEFSAATLLPDGTVLITGSQLLAGAADESAELYNPASGKFVSAGNMTAPRFGHTTTLLPDGTVLIAGGASPGFTTSTSKAELYHPAVLVPSPALLSLSGDGRGPGAILHAATHQVVSVDNPAVAGEALEIYLIGLMDGSVIPPQAVIGGRVAEVLFFGNTPVFAGLNQVDVRVPSGITSGPTVSVRLNYLSRPSNEVTIALQ